jgi:hypothetical protein
MPRLLDVQPLMYAARPGCIRDLAMFYGNDTIANERVSNRVGHRRLPERRCHSKGHDERPEKGTILRILNTPILCFRAPTDRRRELYVRPRVVRRAPNLTTVVHDRTKSTIVVSLDPVCSNGANADSITRGSLYRPLS